MGKEKYKEYTEKELEQFFQDNFIEDDGLYKFLKDREVILKMHSNSKLEEDETELTIKLKMNSY